MVSAAAQNQVVTATKILIVEDEGIIAGHIASRLVRTGYEVSGIAESSEEALAKIAELKPELILMDIRIKGSMDGIETTAKIREHYDIPVIYLTAHTDQQTIDRAKVTGAFGFLTKPIHHTSLSTAIEMAVHKHRADRASRHQRAWMSTMLNTMADAMLVLDRDRRVQFLNGPAEKLTGWTKQEALEMDVSQILPLKQGSSSDDASTRYRKLESAEILFPEFEGHSPCQIPRGLMACKRSGLGFPIEGEIAPCLDGGIVVGTVITFRDATARLAEEEELRHQHKMEAVGRLAAGIAHDFNNLLFLILGYTEEIMRTATLTERDLKALTEIRKAGDNATNITQQLLKFSRKEAIQKQDLNLNEVISDTEELFRRMGGVSVKWNFQLNPSLGLVHGDIGQLKQVLMNLAANARDAMPDGGRVSIETANVDVPRANVSGSVRDTFIALTVTDTGVGMSSDTAEHLFEPFFTTKQPGSGTGLGLSIVHSIVTDHGGTIHVDAEPGQGAAFTLYFPRVAAAAAAPLVERSAAPADSSLQTILLVDDQKDVRRLLLTYLEDSGCRILEAENGEDAIQIARDYPGTIDLLITDVVMPKANGFELARKLVGQNGIAHTIFISGYAQDLVNGLESLPPGARFLPKPFAKRDFLQNVSDLLLAEKGARTMTNGA